MVRERLGSGRGLFKRGWLTNWGGAYPILYCRIFFWGRGLFNRGCFNNTNLALMSFHWQGGLVILFQIKIAGWVRVLQHGWTCHRCPCAHDTVARVRVASGVSTAISTDSSQFYCWVSSHSCVFIVQIFHHVFASTWFFSTSGMDGLNGDRFVTRTLTRPFSRPSPHPICKKDCYRCGEPSCFKQNLIYILLELIRVEASGISIKKLEEESGSFFCFVILLFFNAFLRCTFLRYSYSVSLIDEFPGRQPQSLVPSPDRSEVWDDSRDNLSRFYMVEPTCLGQWDGVFYVAIMSVMIWWVLMSHFVHDFSIYFVNLQLWSCCRSESVGEWLLESSALGSCRGPWDVAAGATWHCQNGFKTCVN